MQDHAQQAVRIVACRPVVPSEVEQVIEIETKQSMSIPYTGSSKGICADCGREVWIGPRQQEFIGTHADTPTLLLCLLCTAQIASGMDLGKVALTTLGNPERPGSGT